MRQDHFTFVATSLAGVSVANRLPTPLRLRTFTHKKKRATKAHQSWLEEAYVKEATDQYNNYFFT